MLDLLMITFFLGAFSSLITIMNPISSASVFSTITTQNSKEEKLAMAKRATTTATLVLIFFALTGNFILSLFSITIDAFRIAGGLIIVRVGLGMLSAKESHFSSEEGEKEAIKKQDVSIIPLAIPMISGPGAMTTSVVLMTEARNFIEILILILTIVLACTITFYVLKYANIFDKYLGQNGKNVVDKIMGLIVLVVGVQFIVNGIYGLLLLWGIAI